MLTLETLRTRLSEWRKRFSATIDFSAPTSDRLARLAPILLYQSFFGLMHDLKTSVHLSEDEQVRALAGTVLASDAHLYRLAYDELELAAPDNDALYALGKSLDSLASIEQLLGASVARAQTPASEKKLPLFEEPFPWEGLARARATSCARHGYFFFERDDQLVLSELPQHEERLSAAVRQNHGVIVVRRIEVSVSANPATDTSFPLTTRTLAAFAPGGEVLGAPWEPVKAPSNHPPHHH